MSGRLISFIVPVYNAARHLPALADMLAAQTKKRFEVIFVNDGSRDESGSMLKAIAAARRFGAMVIEQPNAGVSAARNAGIEAAKGEYVTFIDADDGISPDYAETMARYAETGCELAVFTHSRVVDGDARYDAAPECVKDLSSREMLEAFLANPTRFGVYDFLIRRDVIAKNSLKFPEGYPYYEDYDFTLRLFAAVKGACMAAECVYCYKAASGSAMSVFNDKRMECLELFEDERSLYLETVHGFRDRFSRWFAARLRWSAMWQACISMDTRGALEFGRRWDMRSGMKKLTDYPDRKVAVSARIYIMCPYIYIKIMGVLGKRRTLISRGAEK